MKKINYIPPFKLVPEALDEEAKRMEKFKWASEEVGTRHQLGGKPFFLQKEEILTCPSCKKNMTFYAQIDSINDDYVIADCGMVYVFICFDCNESISIIQSS